MGHLELLEEHQVLVYILVQMEDLEEMEEAVVVVVGMLISLEEVVVVFMKNMEGEEEHGVEAEEMIETHQV